MKAPGHPARELNARSIPVVVGATFGFLVGPTSVIAPPIGLFMVPVGRQFGLDRATFPLLMLMVATIVGISSPFAGRAIDRFGVRKILLPALFLSGLVQIALSFTTGSLPAFLAVMVCVGLLAGIQNPIGYTKVIAQWFNRERALMVSLAAALGSGIGGIVVPQIVAGLISKGGWQWGYAGLGVYILCGLPIIWWLLREPAEVVSEREFHTIGRQPEGVTLGQAASTGTFWKILLSLMLTSCSVSALAVHVPAWAGDGGAGVGIAATFLSLFSLGSILGQLGSGFLLDRFDSARVGSPPFFLASVGAALLLVLAPRSPMLAFDGLLIGLALGAELGLASYFVTRFFGFRSYGQIYGCIYGAMVAGSGSGTVLMGVAYEVSGTYQPAFAMAAGTLLTSAILIASLPRYRFTIDQTHSPAGVA